MQYSDFPDCCGLGIVYRLTSGRISGYNPVTDKAKFLAQLESAEDNARDHNITIAMVATVGEQEADDLLVEAKWTPVFSFTNRNSGNPVTVWIKNVADGGGWRGRYNAEIRYLQENSQ